MLTFRVMNTVPLRQYAFIRYGAWWKCHRPFDIEIYQFINQFIKRSTLYRYFKLFSFLVDKGALNDLNLYIS